MCGGRAAGAPAPKSERAERAAPAGRSISAQRARAAAWHRKLAVHDSAQALGQSTKALRYPPRPLVLTPPCAAWHDAWHVPPRSSQKHARPGPGVGMRWSSLASERAALRHCEAQRQELIAALELQRPATAQDCHRVSAKKAMKYEVSTLMHLA